jgi:tetraprenyl-beta-curcumene synthase
MPEVADRSLIIRACGALALMSARYWATTALVTKRQLGRWREKAHRIPDLALRELAITKLADEQANVYFAATFATLAPRARRKETIEAIIALQIIYDYLDGLTEQPASEPLSDGLELFRALRECVSPRREPFRDYYAHHPHREDNGYLSELVVAARGALAKLPSTPAITETATAVAALCAEAQVRAHAAARLGTSQLERWADDLATWEGVSWREFLAASASAIISIHALVAAAADPSTTPERATRIEAFHRRSTCPLATILDGLADRSQDHRSTENQLGYLRYFPEGDALGHEVAQLARRALRDANEIPHSGHHLMTLAGVVAYYTSSLEQGDRSLTAMVGPLQDELRPMITPILVFMRVWHFGERVCARPPEHRLSQQDAGPKPERLPI